MDNRVNIAVLHDKGNKYFIPFRLIPDHSKVQTEEIPIYMAELHCQLSNGDLLVGIRHRASNNSATQRILQPILVTCDGL